MESKRRYGWNPAAAVLVFCFLQGIIFVAEWFWFFTQLAKEGVGLR